MSEFKVGDRVYCPMYTNRICELESSKSEINYPLYVSGIQDCFTATGKRLDGNLTSNLFHATQENWELLSKLYQSVEFEKPKPTGSDLTRKLFADGAKEVLCWVSDLSDENAAEDKVVFVVEAIGIDGSFTGKNITWNHAVPVPRNHYAMDDKES